MARSYRIHYGTSLLQIEAEAERVAFELCLADVPGVPDVAAEVRRALSEPINSQPLRDLLRKGQQVVVVGDDLTRLTPTNLIVPPLLEEINAGGVPDRHIKLVIATGTHRPMSPDEIEAKYGHEVLRRVRVLNHDCHDSDNLLRCGTTRRGTDVWVNRSVMEADVRIGVGHITPHHPVGWSGGAKILLPGVAGEQTVAQMHLLGATEQQLGKVLTPCREEMEDFARATGLHFILNAVLNRQGDVAHIVAGHFRHAHREGVRVAQRVVGAPFHMQADLTLSSTYPIDFDLFQADKGLFSAAIATRSGGEILLVSPCHDGVSPTHGDAVELAALSNDDLWRLARSKRARDPLSVVEALYLNTAKNQFRVTLVTEGIPRATVERMGFHCLTPAQLPHYVEQRMSEQPEWVLGLLHNSVEVLPVEEP